MQARNRRRWALVAVFALWAAVTSAGCFNTSYTTGYPPGQAVYRQWNSFFLWGLVGDAVVDAASVCPNGVSQVRTFAGPLNIVLTVITVGIYSPRNVDVVCAAGSIPVVGTGPTGPTEVQP